MRAVILAAGEGSRLRAYSDRPKPLIPLLGLSLIERNILALKECGIKEFLIITGYYDQELRQHLGSGRRLGVTIDYLHNPRWQLGNGVSAHTFQQAHRENEKYLLLMADHLFAVDLLQSFIRAAGELAEGRLLLAADRRLAEVYDLAECTKIMAEGNLAGALGKELRDFNAVDCGLFADTGVLQKALAQAIDRGAYALTDAVNLLAAEGKVELYYINGHWVDVDDPAAYRHCEQVLLRSLVSPKDGFISRTINRKFSLRLTKRLAATPVTPNQVTLLSFVVAALSALAFACWSPVIGGLLAQLSSILDGVDGEIARLKFMQSKYGEMFDSILDRYADYLIVLGMAVAWYNTAGPTATVLLVSGAALSGVPMSMLFKEKFRNLTGQAYVPEKNDGRLQYLPANRDGRLLIIMLGGVLNLVPAALVLLAAVTHLQTLWRLNSVRGLL